MKLKILAIILLAAGYSSSVFSLSTDSCIDSIKHKKNWMQKNKSHTIHEIGYIISSMNVWRDNGTRGWVSYNGNGLGISGYFVDSTLTSEADHVFSDRTRKLDCASDLCLGNNQPFDYRRTTRVQVKIQQPNILFLTYYFGEGSGERHKFRLSCQGDFMFGVSKNNQNLAVTFGWGDYQVGDIK
jgi:hypothetical protein